MQILLLIFVAAVWMVPQGWSQAGYSTGTVRGTVLDPQGAAVPNAAVTITNPATGVTRSVATSADGTYQVSELNPGTYAIQVEAPGFNKLVAQEVVVTVGQFVVYDAHLQVGESSTTVQVKGNSAPLIDVDQTQQANTINDRQVMNLPNISRNFTQSIYTLPGVVDSSAPSTQDPNIGTGYQSSGFSIGGSNGRSNLFTIDGGENDFGSGSPRVAHVPQESVQEFQVNRNAFNAEFGFTVGSAINVITKSGTNNFHGNADIYFHDENTDATNFFNSYGPTAGSKPYEQSAIYGGTLGGPIKKNKLFFFTAYERQKLDSSVVINLLGTAAAQGIAGQTNGYNGSSCPAPVTQACYFTQLATTGGAIDPRIAGLGAYFLGSSIFTPVQDPIYKALLTPNSGSFDGNANGVAVQAPPNQRGRYNNWVTRLDYQPGGANSFSLRFSLMREGNSVIGENGQPRYTSVIQTLRDYTITGSWNHVFNPDIVNTVRVQIVPHDTSDNVTPFPGRAEIDLGSLGVQGTNFSFPYLQHQNQYQFDDDLSILKGTHNLKFGESFRPVQYSIYEGFLFGGEYQYLDGAFPVIALFGSTPFGNLEASLAAFNVTNGYPVTGPPSTNLSASQEYVLGIPAVLLQGAGNGQYNATTSPIGFYGQDSWRASNRVTFNYGGRLDIDPTPNNYPTAIIFSPRGGVAWDVAGNGKTVIRAGAGLFTAPTLFIVPFTSTIFNGDGKHIYASVLSATTPTQIAQLGAIGAMERGSATASNPSPALSLAQLSSVGVNIVPPGPNQMNGAFYTVDPNFKQQLSIQASLGVDRQLARNLSLDVSYLFYRGLNIQMIQEANFTRAPIPADPFVGPYYMPKPGSTFGEPNTQIVENDETTSNGSSIYNGLTVSLTKRFEHNLQFQANYTFSKAIDDTSDFSSQSTQFRPDLLSADRSLSDFNIKHSFVANAVYVTPNSRGTLLSSIFANIAIAPIVSVRSGVPFTLLVPGIASNGTSGHTGEARPYHEGRNLGIGPNYADWDMRVSKTVILKRDSGVSLELIAQAANILNHANFTRVGNTFPNTAVTNAAGVTTSALVSTPEGTVDMLNGPYNYKGFVPKGPAQLSDPLAFQSAAPPRQVSFGLEFGF